MKKAELRPGLREPCLLPLPSDCGQSPNLSGSYLYNGDNSTSTACYSD